MVALGINGVCVGVGIGVSVGVVVGMAIVGDGGTSVALPQHPAYLAHNQLNLLLGGSI